MSIISIDGGTTNTRLTLVRDGEIIKRIKLNIGAGNGCSALSDAVSKALTELAETDKIDVVTASGMIGSELGLLNVPHAMAPVKTDGLAKESVSAELFGFKFLFIPGVKCGMDDEETADMMRGEETEFFGILNREKLDGDILAVLPGSHTKLISAENGEIKRCITTIGGEMLAALSKNTILKSALPEKLSSTPDSNYLYQGHEYAKQNGLGGALFKIRVLKNFFGLTDDELCGFFCGAVLSDDISLIAKNSLGKRIVIGGSEPLRSIFALLIEKETGILPTVLNDETAELATVYGALEILKIRNMK